MSEFDHFADMVPDGAVPVHGVRIIDVILPDGSSDIIVKADGDARISSTVGVLDLAKHMYLHEEWEEFEKE